MCPSGRAARETTRRFSGSATRSRRRAADVEDAPPLDEDSSDDEPDTQYECPPGCGCRLSGRAYACVWLCVSTIVTQLLLFSFAEPPALLDGRAHPAHPAVPNAPSASTHAPVLSVSEPSGGAASRTREQPDRLEGHRPADAPLNESLTPPPEGPHVVAVLRSLEQCVQFGRDDPRHLDVTLVSHSSNNRLWSAPTPPAPHPRAPGHRSPPAPARPRPRANRARIGAFRAQWCRTSASGGGGPFVLSELAEESGVLGAVPEPLEIQAGADAGGCTLRRLQLRKRSVDLGKPYPINWLRNQGIRCSGTSHYFMVDVDFWPSAELHGLLLNALPGWSAFNTALVIPNFQVRPPPRTPIVAHRARAV